jgi:hypothetical protein
MKKLQLFYFFFFSLIFLSGIFSSKAQDESKDQLFWIHEESAKINMIDQYESTTKDILNMFKEGGLDVELRTSERDDGQFYYLIPIEKYADVDTIYGKFMSAREKVGEDKWTNKMVENSSTVESSKDGLVRRSAKYSYQPKNPRLKPDEVKFIHWDYFTVLPEKRKEFFDIAKQYKEMYEKNDIGEGYGVWLPDFGYNNDLVVVSSVAKNDEDFYQTNNMVNEKLGKDGEMLWNKLLTTLKDFTHFNGRPRFDLSMMKGK